jgi:outer membrane protein TolC
MPALAAALALAACATGQRKPDLTLPAAYEAPGGTQALAPAALDTWWTLFGDAELNDLEATALGQSPDAKTQIARLVEAGAVEKSGILQTWPTGGISGAASRKTTYPVGKVPPSLIPIGGRNENENVDFRPSWELDFMGGLITERNAVRDDYAATRFNVEGARASLVADVADSYFLARGLAIQLDDARENLRIETELYDVASKRAQHGIGAMADADQVAGELAQRQSTVRSPAARGPALAADSDRARRRAGRDP